MATWVALLVIFAGGKHGDTAPNPMDIVVTLHGVETRALWLDEIHPSFGGIEDCVHVPKLYGPRRFGGVGKFRLWRALFAGTRRAAIEEFAAAYDDICAKYPDASISVIAHSFGTYILAQSLETFPRISLDRVVLCGSIVRCGYEWENARVSAVRNERGGRDWVVRLLRRKWFRDRIPGSGPSGIDGFQPHRKVVQVHFPAYGHSTHFINAAHCANHWLPFLRRTEDSAELCAVCLRTGSPECEEANRQFDFRYSHSITAWVHFFFESRRTEHSLADLSLMVRTTVLKKGARGRERPEALIPKVVLTLYDELYPSHKR